MNLNHITKLVSVTAIFLTGNVALGASVAPLAPSSLSASSSSSSQISLKWLDNSSNEQGFVVQRSLNSSSGFVQIANLAPGTVSLSSLGLNPGTTYYYRVAAYAKVRKSIVYSNFSNVASAMTLSATIPTTTTTTQPPASTFRFLSNPVVSNITSSSVNIQWSLSENGTGQIEYGTTTAYGKLSTKEISFSYSTHLQQLSGLAAGQLYHFRVRSTNQAGVEVISADFTFTTAANQTTTTTTTTMPPSSSLFYPADGSYTRVSIPQLAKPALLTPVFDPTFGTKIVRITNNVAHGYSKVQAWNSNQTLIGIGSDSRTILDGRTYQYLRTLPWAASEVKWSHVDPNKMYGINGNRFVSINATTGAATVLRTFPEYTNIYMGPWEGNISKDDRYVVFISSLGTNADIIVYDIANNVVISQRSLASMGYTGVLQPIDWASVSQSGNYVVITAGGLSTGQNSVQSFDRNLNPVATVFSVGQHGDLGFDSFGNEVFVQVGVSGGPVWMGRLDNGQRTAVLDTGLGQSGHLSCRNILRPGWCYVTLAQTREVLAVKLNGSQIVERFVHHRSSDSSYEATPTAVASPDGTRVMFRSDWYGTSTVDAYVVGTP